MMGPMRTWGIRKDLSLSSKKGMKLSQQTEDQKSLVSFHSRMGNYFSTKEGNLLRGIEYGERSWQRRRGFRTCS